MWRLASVDFTSALQGDGDTILVPAAFPVGNSLMTMVI